MKSGRKWNACCKPGDEKRSLLMKYGESTFDVLYLLFAIVSGVIILRRARNNTEKAMG